MQFEHNYSGVLHGLEDIRVFGPIFETVCAAGPWMKSWNKSILPGIEDPHFPKIFSKGKKSPPQSAYSSWGSLSIFAASLCTQPVIATFISLVAITNRKITKSCWTKITRHQRFLYFHCTCLFCSQFLKYFTDFAIYNDISKYLF